MEAGDCARAHATSNEMRPAARIAAIIFGSTVTPVTLPYNGDGLTGVSPEYTTCVCACVRGGERERKFRPCVGRTWDLGFGRCCSTFRFARQQADLFEPPRVPASAEYADAVLSRTATFYGLRQRRPFHRAGAAVCDAGMRNVFEYQWCEGDRSGLVWK